MQKIKKIMVGLYMFIIFVNNQNSYSMIPQDKLNKDLIEACGGNDIKKIKDLVLDGADVNCVIDCEENDITPLYAAISSNAFRKFEIFDYLLSKGADPTIFTIDTDEGTLNLMEYFTALNDIERVKFLKSRGCEFSDINAPIFRHTTFLCCFAQYSGRFKMLRYLIEKEKADVNALSKEGYSPLYYAVKTGNLDIVIYLVEQGARISKKIISVSEGKERMYLLRQIDYCDHLDMQKDVEKERALELDQEIERLEQELQPEELEIIQRDGKKDRCQREEEFCGQDVQGEEVFRCEPLRKKRSIVENFSKKIGDRFSCSPEALRPDDKDEDQEDSAVSPRPKSEEVRQKSEKNRKKGCSVM